jgi:hypothetical protein
MAILGGMATAFATLAPTWTGRLLISVSYDAGLPPTKGQIAGLETRRNVFRGMEGRKCSLT